VHVILTRGELVYITASANRSYQLDIFINPAVRTGSEIRNQLSLPRLGCDQLLAGTAEVLELDVYHACVLQQQLFVNGRAFVFGRTFRVASDYGWNENI